MKNLQREMLKKQLCQQLLPTSNSAQMYSYIVMRPPHDCDPLQLYSPRLTATSLSLLRRPNHANVSSPSLIEQLNAHLLTPSQQQQSITNISDKHAVENNSSAYPNPTDTNQTNTYLCPIQSIILQINRTNTAQYL